MINHLSILKTYDFLCLNQLLNKSLNSSFLFEFFYNFFSNLGEWTARNGEINTVSATLFNSSLVIFALSYFSFFISFLKLEVKYIRSNWLRLFLMASISVSILSFIFISVFSAEETSKFWHLVFVKIAFRTLFIHAILQTYVVIKIPKFDQFISFTSLGFTILLFLFLMIMDFGPKALESQEGLFIQVTAQKVIVIAIMISYNLTSKPVFFLYILPNWSA